MQLRTVAGVVGLAIAGGGLGCMTPPPVSASSAAPVTAAPASTAPAVASPSGPTPAPAYAASELCRSEERPHGSPMFPGLIDDAEEGSGQIIEHDGRNGLVYSYVEAHAVLVLGATMSRHLPRPILGGAHGSRCAWNLRGELARQLPMWAGLGMDMTNPRSAYDASRFTGVSFFARRTPGSATFIEVLISDANTDPGGQVCTKCFNYFKRRVALSDDWRQYTLPFDSFQQMPGWGAPRPEHLDASKVFAVQFVVNEPGERFDFWLDDIAFVEPGAPPPAAPPPPVPGDR